MDTRAAKAGTRLFGIGRASTALLQPKEGGRQSSCESGRSGRLGSAAGVEAWRQARAIFGPEVDMGREADGMDLLNIM